MIFNLKPTVMDILNSVNELKLKSPSYPAVWSQYPMAIYRTSHQPAFINADHHESQTSWSVTIELYTDNGSLTAITNKLSDAFAELGFSCAANDANTAGLSRVVCQFSAVIDNDTRRVYGR